MTQITFSGRRISDEAVGLLRATHAGIQDGSLRPRLDVGRWSSQRRLEVPE